MEKCSYQILYLVLEANKDLINRYELTTFNNEIMKI